MSDTGPDRPFGEDNRRALLQVYFDDVTVTSANAWRHVYRLLMWTDTTTGLAHCYESDKCQPGRAWYARALAFHEWLAERFDVNPEGLADELDWLFDHVLEDLAKSLVDTMQRREAKAKQQRHHFPDDMPTPGADPRLSRLIVDHLEPWLDDEPPTEVLANMQARLRDHLARENKRKNLLGEGFEDTLAHVLGAVAPADDAWTVRTRVQLDTLPGFSPPRKNEKPRTVDLAVVLPNSDRSSGVRRDLVTAKWSIRADREEQFGIDHDDYARLEAFGEDFTYILLTNEFDPARLKAAVERRTVNAALFDLVVHVNPAGVLAAYDAPTGKRGRETRDTVRSYVEEGRIVGLEQWLVDLIATN